MASLNESRAVVGRNFVLPEVLTSPPGVRTAGGLRSHVQLLLQAAWGVSREACENSVQRGTATACLARVY